jgi:cellulose synthase/poly-beta-1,6-N-acetylglucosamine synthase-like glycosyltransferase
VLLINLLTAVTIFSSALIFIYTLYALVISLFSFKKRETRHTSAPSHRFAIIIAARNEENVIGNLIASLLAQRYPRNLFDVIVVPNNCTDRTRDVSLAAGAHVLDCHLPVKSKGDVLNFAFAKICQDPNYDAVCVFDADNLVHPDFLAEMNNALADGVKVAQGYRDNKNPYDSALASCSSLYFWIMVRFWYHARSAIGLSAGIGGSGFMIRTDLLKQMGGAQTVSITEDLELTILSYLQGERVVLVHDAITYDEQPLSFKQSWLQRKRWTSGLYQVISVYFRQILSKTIRDRSLQGLDLLFLLLTAHMQVLSFGSMLAGGWLSLLLMINGFITRSELIFGLLVSVGLSYLAITALAFITMVLEKKSSPHLLKGVVTFWFFLMTWIPINIFCLFKHSTVWDEIKHGRNIQFSDLSL